MQRPPLAPLIAALVASACARAPTAVPLPSRPAPAAPAAVEEPLPLHWRGAFTMVEAPSGTAAVRQFTLILGADGPNSFTARRGCYSREGRLLRRGDVWLVESDGAVRTDAECLRRGLGAPGFPQALFEHRAISFSPPGAQRWIAEDGRRWTYLPSPAAPPAPERFLSR